VSGPRRLAPRTFRGRIVASTVALMTAVMLVLGVGVQLLLGYTAQRDADRVLEDRADAVVSVVEAGSVSSASLDPGVVVYDERGHVVAGSIERSARRQADALSTVTGQTTRDVDDDLRLLAEPFVTADGRTGVVVVSQDTSPYERVERYALLATVLVGVLVIAVAAGIARRVTTQALAPVTQMAQRAAEWSEHDLAQRFELAPADGELAQLGETLDHLLDRVAMAIRAEQRLTSELAHELRTPLTAIQGSADLALMRGVADDETRADLVEISKAARTMAEVITTLVDVARDPTAAGSCEIAELVGSLRQHVPVHLELVDETGTSTARVAGPRNLVLRTLAPVVDNAVAHARSRITLRAVDLPHAVAITVADDGPGVDARVRERIFDVGASATGGTGLGLGIAQRVARSLGGEILVEDPESGASFVVRLPRA
jgi:signal transduction histidine kinase